MISTSSGELGNELADSTLFGHEKGAFTSAISKRIGCYERAHETTLFLDEVGDLPAAIQIKLLRALQENVIQRVGGEEDIFSTPRLVVATNKEIDKLEVQKAIGFRDDLFYRMGEYVVTIPPLRERPEDIIAIAANHLHMVNAENSCQCSFAPSAMESLIHYPWPGNIRELEYTIKRSVIVAAAKNIGELEAEHLRFTSTKPTVAGETTTSLGAIRNLQEYFLNESGTLLDIKVKGEKLMTALLRVRGDTCSITWLANELKKHEVAVALTGLRHAINPQDETHASLSPAYADRIRQGLALICAEHKPDPNVKRNVIESFEALKVAHENLKTRKSIEGIEVT